jgi:hypothetical protein
MEEIFYIVRENEEWREGNAYVQDERIYNYKTKRDAFQHFLKSVQEHYKRDFWDAIGWSDEIVWTTHSDEAGYTECILEKWDGFDKDVEFGWEYNGKVYKTAKALSRAYPDEFRNAGVWTHHNYCCVTKEGNWSPVQAPLSITYKEEYV